MTTPATTRNNIFARFNDYTTYKINVARSHIGNPLQHVSMPTIEVKKHSNKQLSMWVHARYTGAFNGTLKRKIFSMHKSQHKQFYAIVAELRDVLAKLIELANVCAAPSVLLLPATVSIPRKPYQMVEREFVPTVWRDGALMPAAAPQSATCSSHYCPMCHRANLGNIVDDVWSCSCCPFRVNLATGESIPPYQKKPAGEYLAATAEYINRVVTLSNSNLSVNSAWGSI